MSVIEKLDEVAGLIAEGHWTGSGHAWRLIRDHGPAIRQAMIDAERLGAFAAAILPMDEDFIGDVDGGTLQDAAEAAGLLQAVEVTEPCGDGCNCAGYGDFPQSCYRPTDTLSRAIDKSRATGEGEGHD